ncbi:MAG: hypothetical protein WBK24_03575 [Dethiobacteria bacterium]|jgi:hypothetical protein|nr:hypothetical protein [Bacillota bacterium]HOL15852.1 hypothetical protein [Bacillota bacterium]
MAHQKNPGASRLPGFFYILIQAINSQGSFLGIHTSPNHPLKDVHSGSSHIVISAILETTTQLQVIVILSLYFAVYPEHSLAFYAMMVDRKGSEPGMTDRELLELIANQLGVLTVDVEEIKNILPTLATKQELAEIKSEVDSVKAIVVRIENDHGQKLGALLNGYKLHSERLERLEKDVARHEEILRRMI